jgi:hypothetical protein
MAVLRVIVSQTPAMRGRGQYSESPKNERLMIKRMPADGTNAAFEIRQTGAGLLAAFLIVPDTPLVI